MGVPITFMDKYNPEQFEIVGLGNSRDNFTPNKDYENPKKILKQAIEEISYIYPVDGGAGSDLELRIIKSLEILYEYCGDIQTGLHNAKLASEAEILRMLAKERKLLKN